jgi:AcrR family transcriptional regulator
MSRGRAVVLDPLTPQRRRELTRHHLIEAAAAVFARQGFHGASLDEVAAAAGFTKGAVYSNFKNKEDLFVAVLDDHLQSQLRAVGGVLAEPGTEDEHLATIRELVTPDHAQPLDWAVLYLEFVLYAARNESARATLADFRRRSRETVARITAEEYARLGVEPPLDPDVLATISFALFAGLDVERVIDPDAITDDTVNDAISFFVAAERGFAGPDAVDRFPDPHAGRGRPTSAA